MSSQDRRSNARIKTELGPIFCAAYNASGGKIGWIDAGIAQAKRMTYHELSANLTKLYLEQGGIGSEADRFAAIIEKQTGFGLAGLLVDKGLRSLANGLAAPPRSERASTIDLELEPYLPEFEDLFHPQSLMTPKTCFMIDHKPVIKRPCDLGPGECLKVGEFMLECAARLQKGAITWNDTIGDLMPFWRKHPEIERLGDALIAAGILPAGAFAAVW